ncbi:L,D-transpeptidase family protein [Cutibacterium granulosum]|uniref:L,D-transpeptidase family protein n=1 Tax=Cutibacterium granulosum TaxID=33011 RepID=UPI002B223B10|nr:L,D-transpeptidase family protein [Cutibacterium granulosum]MEA5655016.1 L,D-transpeptidase family protein [Cutibacterium granulosum]
MTLSRTLAAGALSTALFLGMAPLQAHADPAATSGTPTPTPYSAPATTGHSAEPTDSSTASPESSDRQLEESTGTPAPPQRAAQPSTPARPSAPPQKGVVYLNADANVYDLAGKKISRVHVGDHIGSYGRDGNWWHVNHGGTHALIEAKYISSSAVSRYRNHLVYVTNNSYVFAAASPSSKKVAAIKRGSHIGTRGPAQGGWWPVNYRGRDAWLPKVVLSTSEIPAKTVVYATKNVAVKATASSSSRTVGTIRRGAYVGMRDMPRGGWTPVWFRGTQGWVPNNAISRSKPTNKHIDSRCLKGAKVACASKADRKLRYMENGKIIAEFDARFGAPGTQTRNGVFKVYMKHQNHYSTIYHVTMPYAMFFDGGEAIHYSADFARYGWARGSGGCINVRDMNAARWLWNKIPVGTKVVVY